MSHTAIAASAAATAATAATPASSVHALEHTLFFVLIQLVIIILVARLAGQAARRFGQPRAVGEMIAGLLLGPSLLGHLFPEASDFLFKSVPSLPINIISQIGLILLMFQIGMDFEFGHLTDRRNRKAVSWISVLSIGLPFALGIGVGVWSAPYLAPDVPLLPYCLFVGTALSITAVPILGRIMAEFGLTRTHVGAIAISAAAVNDVVGWLLLAVISSLSIGEFSLAHTLTQLGYLALYTVVCLFVVRPLLRKLMKKYEPSQHRMSGDMMAIMFGLIFISGMATFKIGIFAIFGGFMMGVLVHDNQKFVEAWKRSVGDFVMVFFLPIFFTYTGLRTNIAGLDTIALWTWCSIFLAAATIGKLGGAYLGARLGGLDRSESSTIGALMNTRALMELIVLNIGFDLGFIPRDVFTMLVIMAIATTIMTGPALRNRLPKMGHMIPVGVDA
ncbi:cation:proton antiporter [Pseudoduganella chitinolytica]|uniref:Cation:proton antiporter n=1 Tax=Pseudoduganella chitinolytica TaxID=34070 RepID=A0ABY8B994_9BURK|nr:cation:proton antiporter [Pseudoduganella chitinolytica]WEF31558.1 cation:proton antiporter [Pseudoduganella chitinolytica]